MAEVDAVLLLSFGGPEAPEDVMPFLERVTVGRGIPRPRLEAVAQQYQAFGGVSPINEQNKQLQTALHEALGQRLPVYWGNRNWHPLLPETLRQMRADGVSTAAVVITSGYSSYSGCRQYRENLYDAVVEVESDGQGPAPKLLKTRRWFDQPGFLDAMTDNVLAAIAQLGPAAMPELVFTTHSIPTEQAEVSGPAQLGGNSYQRQHLFVAERVAAQVATKLGRRLKWSLNYQSRSGPPSMPWLGPDVNDRLRLLAEAGVAGAVIIPIGFASDHMEVKWDLDTVALETARDVDLDCVRAHTVGVDPRFVAALARLVRERVDDIRDQDRVALAPWGPAPDLCPMGCCGGVSGRPTLCGEDSPTIESQQ